MTSSAHTHKPVSTVSFSPCTVESNGFVPVPRSLFDLALCQDLGKRELRLFLLVIRLTYGCRGNVWAVLRPGDLSAIGIHSSHARLCLRRLLQTGLVLRDGDTHRYRANPKWSRNNSEKEAVEESIGRHNELKTLVGRNLGRSRRLLDRDTLSPAPNPLPASTENVSEQKQPAQPAVVKAQRIMTTDPDLPDTDLASTHWHFDRQQQQFRREALPHTLAATHFLP